MDIRTIDHLEFYVEDAEKGAAELCDLFNFAVRGQGGPETGLPGQRSVLLRQNDITVLVTSARGAGHRAAEHVREHGAGVAVVGFAVDDAATAYAEAVGRGAEPVAEPVVYERNGESATFATVRGFGDVAHRFTSRTGSGGSFAPGAIEEITVAGPAPGLLHTIDHLAVCLPAGTLDATVRWYQEVFNFEQTFEERIVVGRQAMKSKVVQSASRGVTFTIIEPDTTRAPGQIDTFIRDNAGAGVQHVAFLTDDIAAGVRDCTERGMRFLSTPAEYYAALPGRLGDVGVPVATLRELKILADRDYGGVMLQIFTESRHERRTLFYELIERHGARSFGSNNIKALYEAVERQQTTEREALT
ncbi:4-hydroxyphenylpyruvate dioxygenase [Plantactinospora sp. S1510]|uniref:4-hydroxyphenylpyruvate dioxygenase n=1 Tax=Plantactinospora alkalitolerans TaxID=2789879 RepID=A0ABS0GTH7_9ACTN|nr:4-hydroxyphenylpyruvate dioxygenase [Plantactinospora alkalitolerans]MBF9129483.1 4-hydroxyphenylpyruvate dioxygenase [Plantactinospora alkalitolerans]